MNLHTKTGCPWCIDAVSWLRERGYSFVEHNVSRDPAAFSRMVRLSGQTRAPTLEVGGLVLADFDTGQLARFLERHGLHPST